MLSTEESSLAFLPAKTFLRRRAGRELPLRKSAKIFGGRMEELAGGEFFRSIDDARRRRLSVRFDQTL